MRFLNQLLENNRAWANRIKADDPEFFRKLSRQSPSCLWIGCSDGGQPPDFLPLGELVDYRNLANLVPVAFARSVLIHIFDIDKIHSQFN